MPAGSPGPARRALNEDQQQSCEVCEYNKRYSHHLSAEETDANHEHPTWCRPKAPHYVS